jgi:RNA polymerase sigma factor (sigma-70 family)
LQEAWIGLNPFLTKQITAGGRRFALNHEDVEDILQQGFANALIYLDNFDPTQGSAATWFAVIVRRLAVDVLKRKAKAKGISLDASDATNEIAIEDDPSIVIQKQEENHQFSAWLEEALDVAGPMVRIAFEEHYRNKRKLADIASQLKVPIGTIGTWFHRLKLHLKERARRMLAK